MIIQHNISALNSHRQLGLNNVGTSKNLEKLSSGYKINRAGDDAAGLAISEKMRGQIRGLAMAEQNANNGISLIQTAEGGLNETHAILQRMRELAVQSSNGTYKDEVDRENLDKEVQALKSEITRISESTHYNNIKLLDGSLGGGAVDKVTGNGKIGTAAAPVGVTFEGMPEGVTIEFQAAQNTVNTSYDGTGVAGSGNHLTDGIKVDWNSSTNTVKVTLATGGAAGAEVTYTKDAINAAIAKQAVATPELKDLKMTSANDIKTGVATTSGGATRIGSIVMGGTPVPASTRANDVVGVNSNFKLTATKAGATGITGFTFSTDANTESVVNANGAVSIQLIEGKEYTASDITALLAAHDIDFKAEFVGKQTGTLIGVGFGTDELGVTDGKGTGSDGLTFQIGANGSADQRVSLSVGDMSASGIGVEGVDVLSRDSANASIDVIDAAINQVSGTRADLGALQNRLEHTLNNLGVSKENLTAAESSIRDVDMAKEMMEFTKNNILVQASQAMLAQANQLPQGVLSLLR